MGDTFLQAFLEHGAIGLLAIVLLVLYEREKQEVRRLNTLVSNLQTRHTEKLEEGQKSNQNEVVALQEQKLQQLDQIRVHQIQREKEFADALQVVGTTALEAIDKCDAIAAELRRLNNDNRR